MPNFDTHRHIALIYDGAGEDVAATATFLKQGLERRHLCLYAHDESGDEAALTAMEGAGIDVASAIANGRLELVKARVTFLSNGRFDPHAMIATLKKAVDNTVDKELEGLFVTGDMSWALGRHPGADQLMKYESLCSDFFETHAAVSLCKYDRRAFDAGVLREVVLTHPWVLIEGRLCRNFYHVPTGEPLAAALDVSMDIDRVLSDLVIREAAERAVAGTTIAIEGSGSAEFEVEDAGRLARIYSELVLFKSHTLSRAEKRVFGAPRSQLRADHEAQVLQLRGEILALRQRLDFWQDKVRRLAGLDYDAEARRVRFKERSVRLSRRESQLIAALISQHGRSLATRELLWRAWGGNHLAEAQVRTYIAQLRKKLSTLEVPAALVNEPGIGYSLRFDPKLETTKPMSLSR